MKISKILAIATATIMLSPLAANAGAKIAGTVTVTTSGTNVTMVGSMNSRYSSNTVARISAWGVPNGGVNIAATADNGTTFSCFMPTTDAAIDEARALRTAMGNGAIVSVSRTTTSSYCTNLNIQTDSRYLD